MVFRASTWKSWIAACLSLLLIKALASVHCACSSDTVDGCNKFAFSAVLPRCLQGCNRQSWPFSCGTHVLHSPHYTFLFPNITIITQHQHNTACTVDYRHVLITYIPRQAHTCMKTDEPYVSQSRCAIFMASTRRASCI